MLRKLEGISKILDEELEMLNSLTGRWISVRGLG